MAGLCSRTGCGRLSSHTVACDIPAKGMPLAVMPPLRVWVHVELCEAHARDPATGPALFGAAVREAMGSVVRTFSHHSPDWGRATYHVASLTDRDYSKFIEDVVGQDRGRRQ